MMLHLDALSILLLLLAFGVSISTAFEVGVRRSSRRNRLANDAAEIARAKR
jgi:hypothetical protein